MKSHQHVILIHGLARTSRSFNKMAKCLKMNNYAVTNINYPSRKFSIETLTEQHLSNAVTHCQANGAQRIHFVTHSMGAILVRYYLRHHTLPELGHVVMLSPPNKGSEIVDRLGKLRLFEFINGPAGQQLGTSPHSLSNQLGSVNYSVGIITGNRTINFILSLLIPGENDGKVSVERAKVTCMTDLLVVPHTHPMILRSQTVIRQTLHFLNNGKFLKS